MDEIILKQEDWVPRKYSLLREERSQFNGLRNENYIEAVIELEPLQLVDKKLFRIRVNNYRQSNTDGMYEWVGLLHGLRSNITISVDEHGLLNQVENMEHIKSKWHQIKTQIFNTQKKKTPYALSMMKKIRALIDDTDHFSNNLRFVFPYLYLFPPLFNKPISKETKNKGYRELPHLLNIKTVPIVTTEYIRNYNNEKKEVEIEVEGEIDEENFEQDKLTEMIKMLKNRPRIPTIAKLNYMERYRFDSSGQLIQGMCNSLVAVPGSLYREEKTILRQI